MKKIRRGGLTHDLKVLQFRVRRGGAPLEGGLPAPLFDNQIRQFVRALASAVGFQNRRRRATRHAVACTSVESESGHVRVAVDLQPKSLILAQIERWRHA